MQQFNYKSRRKGKSWLFWLTFWFISLILIVGWGAFWTIKNQGYRGIIPYAKPFIKVLPASKERKEQISALLEIAPKIADGEERTFLLLFQNNNELRPGGGYIGSFGIVKIKNEKITEVGIHDSNVFDSRTNTGVPAPYPMESMLRVADWEFRDSNWSPDFPTNVQNAEKFYQMQGGRENFDGAAAISTEVLQSFVEVLGPVTIEGYPGEYNGENVITKLQYQVERGFVDQGIEVGERKNIMKDLAKILSDKAESATWSKKKKLAEKLEEHLNNKDIMLYFKEDDLEDQIRGLDWDGELETAEGDFLMMVDANMASLKSDKFIERNFEYTVDFSGEEPLATLEITYDHNGRVRDWATKDYDSYLRVYVPKEAWLTDSDGVGIPRFGEELGKKYFGFLTHVNLGKMHKVTLSYQLPEQLTFKDYRLKIQKQSGIDNLQGVVRIIREDGKVYEQEVEIENSRVFKTGK